MKLKTQLLTDIADYINSKAGAHLSSLEISQRFRLATDTTTRHLRELVELKLIAVAGGTRIRTYSKIMAETEDEPAKPSRVFTYAPLQVDKHRSERYAEIAALRQSYPSIG